MQWNGMQNPDKMQAGERKYRMRLAEYSKAFQWDKMIFLIRSHPEMVNCARPGSKSLYAPLHQAAHGGAPVEVVQSLLELGAWRLLRTAEGQLPVDIAREKGRSHLISLLEPEYRWDASRGMMQRVQGYAHEIILKYARETVQEFDLRLPELEPILESEKGMHFDLPQPWGGFEIGFMADKPQILFFLVSGWVRNYQNVGGQSFTYAVSPHGSLLVDETYHG